MTSIPATWDAVTSADEAFAAAVASTKQWLDDEDAESSSSNSSDFDSSDSEISEMDGDVAAAVTTTCSYHDSSAPVTPLNSEPEEDDGDCSEDRPAAAVAAASDGYDPSEESSCNSEESEQPWGVAIAPENLTRRPKTIQFYCGTPGVVSRTTSFGVGSSVSSPGSNSFEVADSSSISSSSVSVQTKSSRRRPPFGFVKLPQRSEQADFSLTSDSETSRVKDDSSSMGFSSGSSCISSSALSDMLRECTSRVSKRPRQMSDSPTSPTEEGERKEAVDKPSSPSAVQDLGLMLDSLVGSSSESDNSDDSESDLDGSLSSRSNPYAKAPKQAAPPAATQMPKMSGLAAALFKSKQIQHQGQQQVQKSVPVAAKAAPAKPMSLMQRMLQQASQGQTKMPAAATALVRQPMPTTSALQSSQATMARLLQSKMTAPQQQLPKNLMIVPQALPAMAQSQLASPYAKHSETPIYTVGSDIMAHCLSYLHPLEAHAVLTTPLSKTFKEYYSDPTDMWRTLCVKPPFFALINGDADSDDEDDSFSTGTEGELNHLFGKYRLLYTNFIKCMKYLDGIRIEAARNQGNTAESSLPKIAVQQPPRRVVSPVARAAPAVAPVARAAAAPMARMGAQPMARMGAQQMPRMGAQQMPRMGAQQMARMSAQPMPRMGAQPMARMGAQLKQGSVSSSSSFSSYDSDDSGFSSLSGLSSSDEDEDSLHSASECLDDDEGESVVEDAPKVGEWVGGAMSSDASISSLSDDVGRKHIPISRKRKSPGDVAPTSAEEPSKPVFGVSALTSRLLGPSKKEQEPGKTNLPFSCAIYAVVNWMATFADVKGMQILCLKTLPFLLEDERQRTTGQGAGLTDIVMRAMVLFPDCADLHTAAFHTLVLLARPLGSGRNGSLFHRTMSDANQNEGTVDHQRGTATVGLFDRAGQEEAPKGNQISVTNGTAIILDSMRRFANEGTLQAMACWAMVNLSLIPEQKAMLVRLGGIGATARAMMNHPLNAEVQYRSLFALINLVIPCESATSGGFASQFNKEREMLHQHVAQITSLVVLAMKNFCSHEGILNRACLVLHNLGLNREHLPTLLWTPNCFQMLQWTKANYPGDKVISESAGGTLQRLHLTLRENEDLRQRFAASMRAQQQQQPQPVLPQAVPVGGVF